MLNKLRKKYFWFLDRLFNNNTILENLNEIKLINDSFVSGGADKRIQKNMASILKHAVLNSNFYKNIDYNHLNNFPIINKTIINKNHSDFLTVETDELFKTTTSGSTGTPLIIYQDKVKRNRHSADMIYFNELAGFIFGTKLYYFRVWNKKNSKNLLNNFLQNLEMIDISTMSTNVLDGLLEKMINDSRDKSILSFASSLDVLKNHCFDKNVNLSELKLKCIISMSEELSSDTREFLEKELQCNVVSRYSNMENGFIAQQKNNSPHYKINRASFHVEILKMDVDEPVENNAMGRIVVTDLFNYGMPIIRYDTGDIGVKSIDEKNHPILKSIEGRRVDFISNTKGELLSPHTITNSMWFFADEINQFQFIQNDSKRYTLKLNMKKKEATISQSEILNIFIPYLGKDAIIEIDYVDEIPLLSSGKRKKVVNEMIS